MEDFPLWCHENCLHILTTDSAGTMTGRVIRLVPDGLTRCGIASGVGKGIHEILVEKMTDFAV
jgi:hypothetical protein